MSRAKALPGIEGTTSVKQFLALQVGRGECKVAAEKTRTTKCTCLRDLLAQHPHELQLALEEFLMGLSEKRSAMSRINYADKSLYIVDDDRKFVQLNAPSNQHYALTIPGAMECTKVVLCRSALIELVRYYFDSNWDHAQQVFPSLTVLERKLRKRSVFRVLQYIVERQFAEGKNTSWQHPSFSKLHIPLNTAKHYHTAFRLRHIASAFLRRVDYHPHFLTEAFQGHAIILGPSFLTDILPIIAERGRCPAQYAYVDGQSVLLSADKPKRVKSRDVEFDRTTDSAVHLLLKEFKAPIAAVLGVGVEAVSLQASFLISTGHAPQVPHRDYRSTDLEQHPGKIFLALSPLTESGSFLQVWPRRNSAQCGQVLFIPYGVLLILPGDTVHGGGFLSDFQTQDLRLHLYIYLKPAVSVTKHNIYCTVDEFPMNAGLSVGGPLDLIFSADLLSSRAAQTKSDEIRKRAANSAHNSKRTNK